MTDNTRLTFPNNTSWFVFDKIYESGIPIDINDGVMLGRYVYDKSNTGIYRKEYDIDNNKFYYNEIFKLNEIQINGGDYINLNNFIQIWQPDIEYKVGDMVIGDYEDSLDNPLGMVIARCIKKHISKEFTELIMSEETSEFVQVWEVVEYTNALNDALGNRIDQTYTTKEETVGKKTPEGGEIFNDYENNIAGSMCYTITAIDSENKTYTLDSTEGLAVDDIYSVHLYYSDNTSTQGENIGKITNINNNVVTVDIFYIQENKTFATKESYIDENGLDKEHNTFRIIAKPLIGNRHIGYHSHAEGNNTKAQSKGAHAEGNDTIAFGSWSHSEGKNTQSAYSAHAEGVGTKALGQGSHAEGATTKAKGKYSHAEGHQSQANGFGSHAQGFATHSNGDYSSAEGYESKAFGEAAHAEGIYSKAYGKYSHAEGYSETGVFDGIDGNIDGDYAHAEGFNNKAYAKASHAEGNGTSTYGNYSHTEGNSTETSGNAEAAHAEGIASHAYNKAAHAEGYRTTALGEYSHAEGNGTTVSKEAEAAHAEGKNTIASGIYSHAEGVGTQSIGQYSHAEGYNSIASGATSHAGGTRSEASVWNSFAHGYGVKTKTTGSNGVAQAVFGQFNELDGYAKFIVGNGTSDTDRSNAFMVFEDGTARIGKAPVDNMDVTNKGYVDNKISSLGTVLKYKGSVATYDDLNYISNPSPGDVYNVIDTNMNYAYTTNGWDQFGATADLSGYMPLTGGKITGEEGWASVTINPYLFKIDHAFTDPDSFVQIGASKSLGRDDEDGAPKTSGYIKLSNNKCNEIPSGTFEITAIGVEGNDTAKKSWQEWLEIDSLKQRTTWKTL